MKTLQILAGVGVLTLACLFHPGRDVQASDVVVTAMIDSLALESSVPGMETKALFMSGSLRDAGHLGRAAFSGLGFTSRLETSEFRSVYVITIPRTALTRWQSARDYGYNESNLAVQVSREYAAGPNEKRMDDRISVPAAMTLSVSKVDRSLQGELTFTLPAHHAQPPIEVMVKLAGSATIQAKENTILGNILPMPW